MTFLPSSSAEGAATASEGAAASAGGGSIGDGSGAVGCGLGATAGGSNSDARIREIGGRTVVFFLISPSAAFLCVGCLSISETLGTFRFGPGAAGLAAAGAAEVFGAGFVGAAACERGAGLASGSFFFGTTFDFDAAGLLAAVVVLRAADFAAVLLVVLVAIWLF
jgi:hypothetical protein